MTLTNVLAYVFWHRPRVPASEYEPALRAFHTQLAAADIPGFHDSWTVRTSALPWLDDRPGYEDRYLVEDFTALGVLNEAAVAAAQRTAHDAAAVRAQDGIAGLYRLIAGDPRRSATVASWLRKPVGTGYREFLDRLDIGVGALWQRQLTFGPTPEFQVTGSAALAGATQVGLAVL
jgi:hypothetical protein